MVPMPARYWLAPAKFVQKVPKAGEQQTAVGVKEEARKNNFSFGLAGAGPGRDHGWARLGAPSRADVRMCQPQPSGDMTAAPRLVPIRP